MSMNESTLSETNTLVAIQYNLLELVQKELINYKKDSVKVKNRAYYFRRLQNLHKHYNEFHENHRRLLGFAKAEENEYFKMDTANTFQEEHLAAFSNIQDDFDKAFPPPDPNIVPNTQNQGVTPPIGLDTQFDVHLPKLNINTFTGNYSDWPSFHDSFKTSIHLNAKISSSKKFQYLKGFLAGEAAKLIESIVISEQNYKIAWELLVERYENKRVLFTHHMNVFSSQSPIKNENASEIQQLTSVSRSCMRAIEQLDVVVGEEIFVYHILQKLPAETKIYCLQSFPLKEIPKWEHLESAINSQMHALETIAMKSPSSKSNSNSPANKNDHQALSKPSKACHVTTQSERRRDVCALCSQQHVIRKCSEFIKSSTSDRRNHANQLKLCFNCLGKSHTKLRCPSKTNCQLCGARHHTLLHVPKSPSNDESQNSSNRIESNTQCSNTILNVCASKPLLGQKQILLATAIIKIRSKTGQSIPLRALVDQGSQATLITESAVQRLGLLRIPIRANICGVGANQSETCKYSVTLDISSCNDPNYSSSADAYVLISLTNKLPSHHIQSGEWHHINSLTLADPYYTQPGHVDVLIGADVYANIILPGLIKGNSNEPIAQNTVFGWILSGIVDQSEIRPSVHITSLHSQLEIESLVEKFWEIEEFPAEKSASFEDQWFIDLFQKSLVRKSNGRYIARLPFKSHFDPSATLGSSYQKALNQFHALERRFHRNPQLYEQYSAIINEYIQLGEMIPFEKSENKCKISNDNGISYACCFLPHHPVIKESSSTSSHRCQCIS